MISRYFFHIKKCPDIIGLCESFLSKHHPDSIISIDDFDFIRKDRTDVKNKSGGELLLYYRHSINLKRRIDLEVSQIESIWVEVSLTNSKPFLICSVYQPPNACAEWIDLFEEELSLAQTTGLDYLVMGDINIDYKHCSNSKWANLINCLTFLNSLLSQHGLLILHLPSLTSCIPQNQVI